MSMRKIFVFIIAILTVIGKIIQVPPISSEDSLPLRLDQSARVDAVFSPFGKLNHVYRKQVQEVLEGKQVDFPTCIQEPPETSFWGSAFKSISGNTSPHGLVYDFAKIQYPRSLIDIALYNGKLYYMLEDGQIKVSTISSDFSQIKEHTTHKTLEDNIAKGSFVILPESNDGLGLFINHNQAALFSLKDDSFSPISLYEKKKNFEAAIPLEGNYFAVAYGSEGLQIFSINNNDKTLKVEYELNKDSSGAGVDIRDLAYDNARKILFIVDHNSGLLSIQLTFGSNLGAKQTSPIKKIKMCNLVAYDRYNDELYLNCKELHKFRINNWPIFDEKVLPKLDISVKEIVITQNMIALVGREAFQLLVADRKAEVYEDKLLDKFILTDHYFVSASQDGILIGGYSIIPPMLRCSTRDLSLLGNHRLVFKVIAECSSEYFAKTGFQPGPLANDDKCVYGVYRNMAIWQPATINAKPFMVIGVILIILGVGVLIWWAFSYLSFRRLKNYFDNYQDLQQEGRGTDRDEKKGDGVSVELKQTGTSEKMEKPSQSEQIEIQTQQLHDIQ